MPEFAFVSLDPKVKIQSSVVRKTVRSQAAKSAGPSRKKPAKSKQLIKSKTVSIQEHSQIGYDLLPILARREANPWGLLEPSSNASIQVQDSSEETLSTESESPTLPMEPTNPMLLFQPLLSQSFSPILNQYYVTNMAVKIPDLDAGTPGSLIKVWYPFVLMKENILPVIFLIAGASFANSRQIHEPQRPMISNCLMELKQRSIGHIRRMIEDKEAQNTDESIAAVVKMASYEVMFGSVDAYNMHMKALKAMVAGRGGLGNLGLGGLLSRMILWVDYNAACLQNIALHFTEEAIALPKPMEFGPACFVGAAD